MQPSQAALRKITSIEIRPGDPSVVHHIVFYIKPHMPDTVYNRAVWYDAPRDEKGVEGLVTAVCA